jgi:hypothetical protein
MSERADSSADRKARLWARKWHVIAGIAIAWGAVFLFATRGEPLRLNWGDPWSDGNAMTSGRYFDRYGFIDLAFTPILDVGPVTPDSLRYTHYPPLPDIMNGVQRKLVGDADISTFRLLADLLSLASLVLLFRWLRQLWGPATASVAVLLMATNLIWLQYADTIHHVPYYWFLGFGALVATTNWLDRPRYSMLAVIAGAVFLCDLASYDFGVFIPVCVAITIWMTGRRLRDKAMRPLLLAVLGASVLAVVVKILLLIWALGVRTVLDDLAFQFHERATQKHSHANTRDGFFKIVGYRTWRFFTPFAFALPILHIASLVLRRWSRTRALSLPPASPLLLLAAGIPFVFVFSQLFVEQYHPTLQFLPYYAVGLASVVAWFGGLPSRLAPVAGAIVVLASVGWHLREVFSFDKTFVPRDGMAAVRKYMVENDTRNIVVTNCLVDSPQRYYLERHNLGIGVPTGDDPLAWMRGFFDLYGDAPMHLLECGEVEKTAFDKLMFAYFGPAGRWSWIGNPAAHKAEWEPQVRAINESWLVGLRPLGDPKVTTPNLKLYRFEKATLVNKLIELNATPTMEINFGDPSSNRHKLSGIRFPEKSDNAPGFSWSYTVRHWRHIFTLRGLVTKDVVPPVNRAQLIVRLAQPARRMTVRLLAATSPQGLAVTMNGHSLGRRDVPNEWTELSFDIPAEALAPDGLQQITLETDAVNEHGLGVAYEWLKFAP